MPKITLVTQGLDRTSENNTIALRNLLNGGLSLDNFKGRVLEGTTAGTANTAKSFKHSMSPPPVIALPLTGDVYTASITDTDVDIRSTQVSAAFSVLLIQGKL